MLNEEGFLKFMKYAGTLKRTVRRGWVKKVGILDAESVAEHSYRVALISVAIAIWTGADVGKAAIMALLHDLHESITGDRTPEEGRPDEDRAMLEVLSGLDQRLREAFYTLWVEYREGGSKEARIVKQADKLEMALQALEYMSSGYPKELLEEFIRSAEKNVQDEEFKRMMEAVRREFFKR